MFHKILVLVIKYKEKVVESFGIEDTCASTQICIPGSVVREIRDLDSNTFNNLPNYMKNNIARGSCVLGETEIYHMTGTYGGLKIEVQEHEVNLK